MVAAVPLVAEDILVVAHVVGLVGQTEISQPLDAPDHIASHNSPVVLLVPAVAEVVAVLRYPLDQARSVMYFYYNAYIR